MTDQKDSDGFTSFARSYLGTEDVDDVRELLFGDDGLELISKMSPDPSTLSTPGGNPSLNRPGKYFKPKSSVSRSSKTAPTPATKPTVATGSLRPTGNRISPRSKPMRSATSAKPTSRPKAIRPSTPALPTKPVTPSRARVAKGIIPRLPRKLALTTTSAGAVTRSPAGEKIGGTASKVGGRIKAAHGPLRPWERSAGIAGAATLAGAGGYVGYKQGRKAVRNYRYNNDLYSSDTYPNKLNKSDAVFECEFSKVDEDKHLVFGWASITTRDGKPVVDRQGDWISADEIEKSAYTYVVKSRAGGNEHRRDDDTGETPFRASDMVESFVVTDEKRKAMGLGDDVPEGWWVGYKVSDEDTWRDVKSGKVTGFSIHGRGKRQAVDVEVTQ